MKKENQMIAVCGLDCKDCDIREATNNPKIAQEIADWFKKERNTELKIADIHCLGCRGDRARHWSADCWILQCCVDKKGLEFCYQCNDFPCDKLNEWSKQNQRYGKALERLKRMQ
ncbi:MAG: DUF3795 domain-containing protein [bacterium]|nr:DUF3795 domain-containing protein [candidate division WOR-3 bacterium]